MFPVSIAPTRSDLSPSPVGRRTAAALPRLAAALLLIAAAQPSAQADEDGCKADTIFGKICGQIQTSGPYFWSATRGGGIAAEPNNLIGTNGDCSKAATFTLIRQANHANGFQLLAPDGQHLLQANGGGGVGQGNAGLAIHTDSKTENGSDQAFRIVAVSQPSNDQGVVSIQVHVFTRNGKQAALTVNPRLAADQLKAQAIGWCDRSVQSCATDSKTYFLWKPDPEEHDAAWKPNKKHRSTDERQPFGATHNHPNCVNGLFDQTTTSCPKQLAPAYGHER